MSESTPNGRGNESTKQRELAEIPPSWVWATPIEIAANEPNALAIGPFGSNLKTIDYKETGTPLIFVRNIRANRFGGDSTHYVTTQKALELKSHSVSAGDVLVTKMGEPPGDAAVYPSGQPDGIITADCIKVRPNSNICHSRYLAFAINCQTVRSQIADITQGVAQQKVSLGRFSSIRIPIAPVPEQVRIVEKLDELLSDLDAGVAALQKARAKLKQYRAAVLKAAVTGELTADWRAGHPNVEPATKLLDRILAERRRKWEADQQAKFAASGKTPPKGWKEKYREPTPCDTTALPPIPSSWCWSTIDSVSELSGGVTKGQKRKPEDRVREVPYLRVANVQRGFLDLSEIKTIEATEEDISELQLKDGDILFNEGGDRDKLGRGWVWRGQIQECIHQNHVFRARLVSDLVHPEFISHHGNTFGRDWFSRAGVQSVNLASINLSVLRRFPVPLSPAAEQEVIISEIQQKLSVIDATEAYVAGSLKRATRLRQSILKEAFAGRLVPQDPNDEPASVLLQRIKNTTSHPVRTRGRRPNHN